MVYRGDILLLGANGQVGWELRRSLLTLGRVIPMTRHECDLRNAEELRTVVRKIRPSVLVNAAAYTAVDKAESEPEEAMRINWHAPAILAEEVKKLGGLMVDYSTDYVFDGSGQRASKEDAPSGPVNTYGRSKLAGLRAVQESGCRHLVFRVSWVYGAQGKNFVKTILRLARQQESLRVVSDQVGSPTPADLIADVTASALLIMAQGKGAEGVFNLSPEGETSWHGFAQAVVAHARANGMSLKLTEESIHPISTAEYPTAALRPANSRLDSSKLKRVYGLRMPAWDECLPRIIQEIVRS